MCVYNRYLDQKRYMFSRFYFVSDPMLLEILGQSSNSHSIQPYLPSLFDNIAKLVYSPTEYDTASDMVSREGEDVTLERPVACVGGVENWLNVLLNESKTSVNQIIANVANYVTDDPAFEFLTMVNQYPSQVNNVRQRDARTVVVQTPCPLSLRVDGLGRFATVVDDPFGNRDQKRENQ